MTFLRMRKLKKQVKELLHHARHVRFMREDVMQKSELADLSRYESELALALKARDESAMTAGADRLQECLAGLTPRRQWASLCENFEIIVVAVAVAMAFRAYFFQPFKIPTGSMQPTLYGVHSRPQAGPALSDRIPFRFAKWAVFGDWYRQVDVREGGVLSGPAPNKKDPASQLWYVGGRSYRLPKDARPGRYIDGKLTFYRRGERVPAGARLWSGVVTAGDHIFVDKIKWNCRLPQRGEIMVFNTRDIPTLPAGTHYIKRMAGLPDERLAIDPPKLIINGEPVTEPAPIARIANREKGYEQGYRLIRPGDQGYLRTRGNVYPLGPDQYFALGDNTGNSRDSRYWGAVPRSNLVGPAFLVYWPFASITKDGSVESRWGAAD